MSANIELSLLTRVIDEGDFHTLEKGQITESYFMTPEGRELYRFLKDMYHHPSTTGQVPSREMVSYRFPQFPLTSSRDAVSVLSHELRRQKVGFEVQQMTTTALEMAIRDPFGAVNYLKGGINDVVSLQEAGQDLSMASAFGLLSDRYTAVQSAGGLLGIPYPWTALNEETQGMEDGQFIVIYGRPKSMKTWLSIYIACHAYIHSRRRVLFYSKEMPPAQIAGRVATAMAGVDYKAFRNGKLPPEQREMVFRILQELKDDEAAMGTHGYRQPFFIITSDRSSKGAGGGGGISWLQSKIRETDPDLVVVDGMYLMKDDRTKQRSVDWRQIAHISQDIKLTAGEFDVPIIGVTQANRGAQKTKGDDLTELAFSDALGMDADAVFRASRKVVTDDSGARKTYLYLTAPGLREGEFGGIVLNAHPAVDFSYYRHMTPEDMNEDEDPKKPRPAMQRPAGQGMASPKPSFMLGNPRLTR